MRAKRQPTRTPGTLYYVRQHFPTLRWQVVSVETWQAEAMRRRGETLYETSAQAHAIVRRLNAARVSGPQADEVHVDELERWPRSS